MRLLLIIMVWFIQNVLLDSLNWTITNTISATPATYKSISNGFISSEFLSVRIVDDYFIFHEKSEWANSTIDTIITKRDNDQNQIFSININKEPTAFGFDTSDEHIYLLAMGEYYIYRLDINDASFAGYCENYDFIANDDSLLVYKGNSSVYITGTFANDPWIWEIGYESGSYNWFTFPISTYGMVTLLKMHRSSSIFFGLSKNADDSVFVYGNFDLGTFSWALKLNYSETPDNRGEHSAALITSKYIYTAAIYDNAFVFFTLDFEGNFQNSIFQSDNRTWSEAYSIEEFGGIIVLLRWTSPKIFYYSLEALAFIKYYTINDATYFFNYFVKSSELIYLFGNYQSYSVITSAYYFISEEFGEFDVGLNLVYYATSFELSTSSISDSSWTSYTHFAFTDQPASITISKNSITLTLPTDGTMLLLEEFSAGTYSELTSFEFTVELTCSMNSVYSIAYSVKDLDDNSLLFISISGTSGANTTVSVESPSVNHDLEYTFIIESCIEFSPGSIVWYPKLISFTILDDYESQGEVIAKTTTQTIAGVSVLSGSAAALITSGSSTSVFSLINNYQLILLFPLLNIFLPTDIMEYIKGVSFSLFTFPFLTNNYDKIHNDFFQWKINHEYLNDIGVKMWASILNIMHTVVIWLVSLALNALIALVKSKLGSPNTWCFKFSNFAYEFLTLGFYIRLALESFVLTFLTTSYELYNTKLSTTASILSFIITVWIFGVLVFGTVFTVLFAIKSTKPNFNAKESYFKALIEGIKPNKGSRLFFFVFILRRAILIMWITVTSDVTLIANVAVFWTIQLFYYSYFLTFRPMMQFHENIIELINESIIVSFWILLLFINHANNWSSLKEKAVYFMLMSGTVIVFWIQIIVVLNGLIKYWKAKWPVKSTSKVNFKSNVSQTNLEFNIDKSSDTLRQKYSKKALIRLHSQKEL